MSHARIIHTAFEKPGYCEIFMFSYQCHILTSFRLLNARAFSGSVKRGNIIVSFQNIFTSFIYHI